MSEIPVGQKHLHGISAYYAGGFAYVLDIPYYARIYAAFIKFRPKRFGNKKRLVFIDGYIYVYAFKKIVVVNRYGLRRGFIARKHGAYY